MAPRYSLADIPCPYRISRLRKATADTAEHFITPTIRSTREPALRASDGAKCGIHFPEAETFHHIYIICSLYINSFGYDG